MEKTIGAVDTTLLTAQAGLANLPNINAKVQSTNDVSFGETLMKASQDKPSVNATGETYTKKTVATTDTVNNSNIKTKENVVGQKEESLDNDKAKDAIEAVSNAVNEIKDKIKEELNVSDEDIEKAMEVLGLTSTDLFNQMDLRSLVMELTGTNDSIELLTNVELYDGLKQITEFAEVELNEISKEVNIPKDELLGMMNEESFKETLEVSLKELPAEKLNQEVENGFDASSAIDDLAKPIEVEVNIQKTERDSSDTDETLEPAKDAMKILTGQSENTDSKKTEQVEEKTFEVSPEVEKTEGTRTSNPIQNDLSKDSNSSSENQGNKKQSFDNSKAQEVNVNQTQQQTTQTVNTVGDVIETVTSYRSYADTENIMRQVTDYVKVNITDDVTKMEMQLHPASLGTVNMQINSQNGQITAHLTVQNELVKSILESQMVKLQETFNEQGTKVTSIEVSVATGNLDTASDNNYSQARDNSQGSSKRRNINLNEIGSFDELTDEELLETKVMEMNGSSVNYTA